MSYRPKSVLAAPKRHQSAHDLLTLAADSDSRAASEAKELLRRLESDAEDSTKLFRDNVVDRYIWFARRYQSDPLAADPQIVAAWFYKISKKHGKGSIKMRAAILRDAFERRGLPSPLEAPLVAATLRALIANAREKTVTNYLLLVEDYRKLKRAQPSDGLKDTRDTLALGFAFICVLHIDSIVRLRGSDISFEDDRLIVRSTYKRKALTQQIFASEGDGFVELLRDYLERAQIGDGHLFARIHQDRAVDVHRAIGKTQMNSNFKSRLVLAGYDQSKYSHDSLRQGFLYSGHLRQVNEVDLAKRAGIEELRNYRDIIEKIETGDGRFVVAVPKQSAHPLSLADDVDAEQSR